MTFSPNEMVREFMVKFERPVDQPLDSYEDRKLCFKLMDEELDEVTVELDTCPDEDYPQELSKERLTKELCDLLYVTYFTANKFGLPVEEAFKRVHESNLSKLDDNGKPLLREDGKILKSENYKPADLKDLF